MKGRRRMSLRSKTINPLLQYKTCNICKETYPRDDEHFYKYKHKGKKDTFSYNSYCIKCDRIRGGKYREKDKASGRKKERQLKYLSTENGYFRDMWSSVLKSVHGCLFKNFEEFFECWKEQQKLYGNKCPYLGVEMTRIRGKNTQKAGVKSQTTPTNISKDRILSNLPYGKDNLMFVSWKANNEKGNITPFIARKYLEIIEQRSLIKQMVKIDEKKILNEHGEFFDEIKSKKKVMKMLHSVDITAEDKNGNSFFREAMSKLRKSIGPEGMKQFYEVAYSNHKKELQEKEEKRRLIKIKHRKVNET